MRSVWRGFYGGDSNWKLNHHGGIITSVRRGLCYGPLWSLNAVRFRKALFIKYDICWPLSKVFDVYHYHLWHWRHYGIPLSSHHWHHLTTIITPSLISSHHRSQPFSYQRCRCPHHWRNHVSSFTCFLDYFKKRKKDDGGIIYNLAIFWVFNPLSPKIQIQILQTDLHTFL